MKKFILIFLSLALLLLLSACSGGYIIIPPLPFPTGQPTDAPTPSASPAPTEPSEPTPSASSEPTDAPTEPTASWQTEFLYQDAAVSGEVLTRFNDGVEGSGDGLFSFTDDGLLIQQVNGSYADTYGIYSGANLLTADYDGCTYVGLRLENRMNCDALFGIQGSTATGSSIFVHPAGSPIVLVDADGRAYTDTGRSGVYSRYCFTVPALFNGCVLIPTDRIVDHHVASEAKPWDLSPFALLGFHMCVGGTEGILVRELFLCRETLPVPEQSIAEMVYITDPNYSYTDEQRMTPFWESDIMYNEAVAFTETESGIYGTTLFVPSEILSVVDVSHRKEYVAGKDFVWIEGTNRIEWVEGSSIPYFYAGALLGSAAPDSDALVQSYGDGGFDSTGRACLADVLYCTGEFLYSKQFCVTYRYDPAQAASQGILHAPCQGEKLSRTVQKLENGEDLNVLFYGDSIFSGCDASSMHGRAPYMPMMSELIAAELQKQTTGTVRMTNLSVGGWSAEHGLTALSGSVNGTDYSHSYQGNDLLILSFGMNNIGTAPESFRETTKAIIDTIRASDPELEVILVSCMNPNPECSYCGNQQYFGAELQKLSDADAHIAYVDFFSVHQSILQYKSFASTTGNNINHPNDWLIRVYAQNILAALTERRALASVEVMCNFAPVDGTPPEEVSPEKATPAAEEEALPPE